MSAPPDEKPLTDKERQELHILLLIGRMYSAAAVAADGIEVDSWFSSAEVAGAVVRMRERGWAFDSSRGWRDVHLLKFMKVGS